MVQLEYFPIDNPCQQTCRFNRQQYCRVCLRHRNEKKDWDTMTDTEKRAVLRKCHRRKLAYRRAEYQLLQAQKQTNTSPSMQPDLFQNPNKNKNQQSNIKGIQHDDDNPQLSLF